MSLRRYLAFSRAVTRFRKYLAERSRWQSRLRRSHYTLRESREFEGYQKMERELRRRRRLNISKRQSVLHTGCQDNKNNKNKNDMEMSTMQAPKDDVAEEAQRKRLSCTAGPATTHADLRAMYYDGDDSRPTKRASTHHPVTPKRSDLITPSASFANPNVEALDSRVSGLERKLDIVHEQLNLLLSAFQTQQIQRDNESAEQVYGGGRGNALAETGEYEDVFDD